MMAVICFMAGSVGGLVRLDLSTELRCDRVAPVAPEGAVSDADADRRLAPLVLVDPDEPGHTFHVGTVETGGNDLLGALVLFHVAGEDRVEHVVGWQAVLVLLIGPQLG